MSDRTTRWLDGQLPDELRSVLQSARADDPSPAQLASLRSGLETALGEMAFASRAATAHSAAVESGTSTEPAVSAASAKIAPVAITLGAVVALVLAGLALRNATSPARDDARSMPTVRQEAPVVHAPSAAAAPQPSAAPIEAVAKPAEAPMATVTAPPSAEGAPVSRVVRTHRAAAAPRPAHQYTLAEELASLDRIRAQLDNPPKALAAAARHAKKFTNGALIPERELLELEALLREGRTAEARKLAKRMTSTEGFPYRTQVSQLLATY